MIRLIIIVFLVVFAAHVYVVKIKNTGENFDHRRCWVEDKLLSLSQVFAIDVCAYAVMSNHTHMVLFVNEATAKGWSTLGVLERWHQLFKGTLITQQYSRGEEFPDYLMASLLETIEVYRNRLMDISWFMRLLNQSIATQAYQEDNCTGHLSDKRAAFLLPALLRTVHAGFPAHGSSLSKSSR